MGVQYFDHPYLNFCFIFYFLAKKLLLAFELPFEEVGGRLTINCDGSLVKIETYAKSHLFLFV